MRSADERREALARGAAAEQRVAEILQVRGWTVLDRNWRGGGGELDLVVRSGGKLRFVEVKARQPDDPVGLDAVGVGKRRRLVGAARAYLLQEDPDFDEVCFLVVLFSGETLHWIDNAFDA